MMANSPAQPLKLPYLGPRLRALFQLIAQTQRLQPYDCIWDCCCDHGYLGIKIVARQLCSQVIFVDQVAHLIDEVGQRLNHYPPERYITLTADASDLTLSSHQRHLVVIAGVGGEHTVDIVRKIQGNHSHNNIDFLFCPTTTQFDLRQYLHHQPFELLHESMVTERGRGYEVLLVRKIAGGSEINPVSLTGNFWDLSIEVHRQYLTKLITHYQRRTRGNQSLEAQRVLAIYQQKWKELQAKADAAPCG